MKGFLSLFNGRMMMNVKINDYTEFYQRIKNYQYNEVKKSNFIRVLYIRTFRL